MTCGQKRIINKELGYNCVKLNTDRNVFSHDQFFHFQTHIFFFGENKKIPFNWYLLILLFSLQTKKSQIYTHFRIKIVIYRLLVAIKLPFYVTFFIHFRAIKLGDANFVILP